VSTSENTSKNRKLLDEGRDVMDGDEYLDIEVELVPERKPRSGTVLSFWF